MNVHPLKYRLLTMVGFFLTVLGAFFFVLYQTQIVHGSEYLARSISSNAQRETVDAGRGIITDRNGKLLVSNRMSYTLTFSSRDFADDRALNNAILRLISLCEENDTPWLDELPMEKEAPYRYLPSSAEDDFRSYLKNHSLWAEGTPFPQSQTLFADLKELYAVAPDYTAQQARTVVGVRYALALYGGSYVLAENVDVSLLSQISDGRYEGAKTGIGSRRVYNTPCAAHILGRISHIYQEDWAYYADLGYSMDALVGESGVERAFETYLHGRSGTRLYTTDKSGKVTGELYASEPQPGGTVALTLDIDLQKVCEDALAETIDGMIDKDSNQRGGAIAVTQVGTGEVLALASYPTFDLSAFNETYSELLEDDRLPMFNRATSGTYAPGSTFKLCTAVAAMESGVITPTAKITDRGVYTYYPWPQPMCWLWRQSGTTHGAINVSQAITESCNYFFYEVGRLTGISVLNDYALQFGLGRSTGIEIGDAAGALASAEYAEEHGLDWSEGQVITAAIGQSYNLFTPLQLSNYVATLVSGGQHYQAHLLKNVKSYDNSRLLYVYNEGPENVIDISEDTLQAVKTGMHDLAHGSLAYQFSDCPVDVGCKTGSAQVGTDIANGVFVAFAPYDDPEIAVAVVIEKGGSGAALAGTAAEVISAYFSTEDASITSENTLLK